VNTRRRWNIVRVVLTTVYSAYFVGVMAAGLESSHPGIGTLLWTVAVGVANLLVLASGPVVGAMADYHASKKRFLLVTTAGCVLATALLALVPPGQVALAMLLVTLSAIAFSSGENLIAAFLPEISGPDRMGRVAPDTLSRCRFILSEPLGSHVCHTLAPFFPV